MPQGTLKHVLPSIAVVLLIPAYSSFAQPLVSGLPVSAAPEFTQQTISLEYYRREIQDLETSYGAYDMRLGEALQGLGVQLLNIGNLPEARSVYTRALQISRINEGLYNSSQIVLVSKLIEIDLELRDWERVDRHYAYLENLYGKIFSAEDPRLETALRELVTWHIDAANLNLEGKRSEHLRALHRLYKTRLQVALNTVGPDDNLTEYLRRRVAASEYQIYAATGIPSERRRQAFYSLRERYLFSLD